MEIFSKKSYRVCKKAKNPEEVKKATSVAALLKGP